VATFFPGPIPSNQTDLSDNKIDHISPSACI
jgi:hypothetical protein